MGNNISITIEGDTNGPALLKPPMPAKFVVKTLASKVGAQTGALFAGRRVIDEHEDLRAGKYVFKPGSPWYLHPRDNSISCSYERCSAIVLEEGGVERVIGTAARLTQTLCVSAAHIWVKDGCQVQAHAFGGPMKLVASFPYYGIILLRAINAGPCFALPSGLSVPRFGKQILGFAHVEMSAAELDARRAPTVAQGRIVGMSPTCTLAEADFGGALCDAPGGVVLFDSCTYAGTLVNAHQASIMADEDGPSPERIDRRASQMWPAKVVESSGESHTGEKLQISEDAGRAVDEVMEKLMSTAEKSPIDDEIMKFVPAQLVMRLARGVGALDAPQWPHMATAGRARYM